MTSGGDNTLMVAVGSSHGDDQAAWRAADLLDSLLHEIVQIRKASIPLNMLDWLSGIDKLHIIDACTGGGKIGSLVRIVWPGRGRSENETLESANTRQQLHAHVPPDTYDSPVSPDSRFQLSMLRAVGTHDFDVPSVLDLAKGLNRLPRFITIWAIVGQNFAPQQELSDVVESQLPTIVQTIRKDVFDA